MREIDEFAALLLEESKGFLARAEESEETAKTASLHAALLLGFCSLEAYVNAVASEFAEHAMATELDKSVLLERELRLDNGQFQFAGLKMYPLNERILFLHNRFARPVDRQSSWWSALGSAIDLRNKLTHPKHAPAVTERAVSSAIQAIIDTLNALFLALYGNEFPSPQRRVKPKMKI